MQYIHCKIGCNPMWNPKKPSLIDDEKISSFEAGFLYLLRFQYRL